MYAVAAERGARAPQLFRKGGRAPPKLYECDVINTKTLSDAISEHVS